MMKQEQMDFFRNINLTPPAKPRKVKEEDESDLSLIFGMSGYTSVAVLESTLRRLIKFTGVPYKGHLGSAYKEELPRYYRVFWDVVFIRACANLLLTLGVERRLVVEMVQNEIYFPKGTGAQGRAKGVKGERMGEGRKKQGSNRLFYADGTPRIWRQVSINVHTRNIISYTIWLYNRAGRQRWSQQKLLTIASRCNLIQPLLMNRDFLKGA